MFCDNIGLVKFCELGIQLLEHSGESLCRYKEKE